MATHSASPSSRPRSRSSSPAVAPIAAAASGGKAGGGKAGGGKAGGGKAGGAGAGGKKKDTKKKKKKNYTSYRRFTYAMLTARAPEDPEQLKYPKSDDDKTHLRITKRSVSALDDMIGSAVNRLGDSAKRLVAATGGKTVDIKILKYAMRDAFSAASAPTEYEREAIYDLQKEMMRAGDAAVRKFAASNA
jgi:hypothetical protein